MSPHFRLVLLNLFALAMALAVIYFFIIVFVDFMRQIGQTFQRKTDKEFQKMICTLSPE